MTEKAAVFPSAKSGLGFCSWAREFAAAAFVTAFPQPLPQEDVPHGDGSPVLLIPGFLSGDWSTVRARVFLAAIGYRPETARLWFNPGPTQAMMAQLEETFLRLAGKQRVSLVGVSLGGVLARDLARRHASAVRCLVTLCSPVRFPVTTPLAPFARMLSPLHDPAWLARSRCIAAPLAIPVTAIHSKEDGVVDWRQCLLEESPWTRNVAVKGRHMTIASNPEALTAIAWALAGS
jgi:hypothetical protein